MKNLDITEEMSQLAAKEMANVMDWSILTKSLGYCMVDLPRYVDNHHAIDVRLWVEENCSGHSTNYGRSWAFERKEDAAWFKLRWIK